MAALNQTNLSFADWAKRLDPDSTAHGNVLVLFKIPGEILSPKSPLVTGLHERSLVPSLEAGSLATAQLFCRHVSRNNPLTHSKLITLACRWLGFPRVWL